MPIVLSPFIQRFLNAAIFLFIPLAIVAPHAIVWEVIAGGGVGLYYACKQPLVRFSVRLVVTLLALPLWAMVTALWAKYPFASFLAGVRILILMISGIYWCRLVASLPQTAQRSLVNAFLGGLFSGLLFLLADWQMGNPWQLFWHKTPAKAFAQGSLMVSLAAWPAALWILQQPYSTLRRAGLLACLFFSVSGILLKIDCDTSYVGLFLGIIVFSGFLGAPRLAKRGMRLGIPAAMICFPLVSLYAFKPDYIPACNQYIHHLSHIERLHIWNDVAHSILEHPWRGIGMDGTRYHAKASQVRNWIFEEKNGNRLEMQSRRFPVHPHNGILQLWLELGILGFFWGIVLACQILYSFQKANLSRNEQAVSNALFAGTLLVIWINLGFWQNWWISGVWIIAGLTLALVKERERMPAPGKKGNMSFIHKQETNPVAVGSQ